MSVSMSTSIPKPAKPPAGPDDAPYAAYPQGSVGWMEWQDRRRNYRQDMMDYNQKVQDQYDQSISACECTGACRQSWLNGATWCPVSSKCARAKYDLLSGYWRPCLQPDQQPPLMRGPMTGGNTHTPRLGGAAAPWMRHTYLPRPPFYPYHLMPLRRR